MASVISVGLHNPSAVPYLITEGILATEHSRDQYDWVTSDVSNCPEGDEEILATERCVVWSQGGLARRVFRFDVEGQTVVQATLAWFPGGNDDEGEAPTGAEGSSGSVPSSQPMKAPKDVSNRRSSGWSSRAQSYSSELYFRHNKRHGDDDHQQHNGCCSAPDGRKLVRALVVALRTQAHIYFLSGSSHVVHLPFEVDSIHAAPRGVIIKRKFLPLSSRPPVAPPAPPNSFALSFGGTWPIPSLQDHISGSNFSTPEKHNKGTQRAAPGLTGAPMTLSDDNLPRLFCLSDPLMEMQLILTTGAQKLPYFSRLHGPDNSSLSPLSSSDELLFISTPREFLPLGSSCYFESAFAISLTFNRQTGMYTTWKVLYTDAGSLASRVREFSSGGSGTLSKRRSSFGPGAGTGANTPMAYGTHAGRESYGGGARDHSLHLSQKGNISANPRHDDKRLKDNDQLASSLDLDFDTEGIPAKESRRVSSLLARADLTTNQNKLLFSDLAAGNVGPSAGGFTSGTRRGDSLGGYHSRSSFIGGTGSFYRAPVAALDNTARSESGSLHEDGADAIMDDSFLGPSLEGNSAGPGSLNPLRSTVLFEKIDSFSAETATNSQSTGDGLKEIRVFTLVPPQSPTTKQGGSSSVILCIVNKKKRKLLILTFRIERVPRHTKRRRGEKRVQKPDSHEHDHNITIKLIDISQEGDINDAINLVDRDVSRILVLRDGRHGQSSLTIQSPWSGATNISLPRTLKLFDYGLTGLSFLWAKRNKLESSEDRQNNLQKLVSVEHINAQGMVDVLDGEGKRHRLQIEMRARSEQVAKILDVCRWVLPGNQKGGEGVLIAWWEVLRWLRTQSKSFADDEWAALIITLMAMAVMFMEKPRSQRIGTQKKRSLKYSRSSSAASIDMSCWNDMVNEETSHGSPYPAWISIPGWDWCLDQEREINERFHPPNPDHGGSSQSKANSPITTKGTTGSAWNKKCSFLLDCAVLAREFISSPAGLWATGENGCLPTARSRDPEIRRTALPTILVGLHLYREELKLNITSCESDETGAGRLAPLLAQLGSWLGWEAWGWKEPSYYSTEAVTLQQWAFEEGNKKLCQASRSSVSRLTECSYRYWA